MGFVLNGASSASSGSSSADSLAIPKPSGGVTNNVRFALVVTKSGITINTIPTGWTHIRTTAHANAAGPSLHSFWYLIPSSGENTSHTFGASASQVIEGGIVTLDTIDTITPVNNSGESQGSAISSLAAPAVVADITGTWALRLYGLRDAASPPPTVAPPSGSVERFEVSHFISFVGYAGIAEINDTDQTETVTNVPSSTATFSQAIDYVAAQTILVNPFLDTSAPSVPTNIEAVQSYYMSS